MIDDNDGQMIFGDLVDLKLPDICLTGEGKPRKHLTQETCPDRGSNPGLLYDSRACSHLAHSGGHHLRSVQMLKREWGEETNGKLPHLSIPSKTTAWVFEVCGGRPAFEQNCSLGSRVCSEGPVLEQNTDDDDDDDDDILYQN